MRFGIYIIIGIVTIVLVLVYLKIGDFNMVVSDKNISEIVKLNTKDGFEIIGDYYEARGDKGVLLLHMMPADRKGWTKFAEKLQEKGFKVLAIDLRGHGESSGGPDGYKKFSDAEHQASGFDVGTGAEFLGNKGVKNLHLAGASIGANLALKYLSEHPGAKSAVLLSPGLDYRGIKIIGLVKALKDDQAVFAVASEGDKYSFDSVNKLFEGLLLGDLRMIKVFENAGHGTTIFEKEPEFMDEIISWIIGLN